MYACARNHTYVSSNNHLSYAAALCVSPWPTHMQDTRRYFGVDRDPRQPFRAAQCHWHSVCAENGFGLNDVNPPEGIHDPLASSCAGRSATSASSTRNNTRSPAATVIPISNTCMFGLYPATDIPAYHLHIFSFCATYLYVVIGVSGGQSHKPGTKLKPVLVVGLTYAGDYEHVFVCKAGNP